MSNDYRNCEGYPDPTAGEALSRIAANEKQSLRAFRPIVYTCSPFSGDVETNVANARRYSRYAVDKGYIPIAPHLLFPQFLDDDNSDERELGLFFGNALMSKCAEVWVFGSRISSGMEAEIKRAKWKGYHLRHFTEECQEENVMGIESLGIASVAAITVICYLIGVVCKAFDGIDDKYIPSVVGVSGAVLGVIGFVVHVTEFPETDILTAVAVGIVSGLASTGVNQMIKQLGQ